MLHRIVESLVVNPACGEFVIAPKALLAHLASLEDQRTGREETRRRREGGGGGKGGGTSQVSVMRGLDGRGREGQGDGNQF